MVLMVSGIAYTPERADGYEGSLLHTSEMTEELAKKIVGLPVLVNHDESLPVGKVKQTLWEIIRRKGDVDAQLLKDCSRISHTECNVCRKCSMYCPFGIDIAYLLLVDAIKT